MRPAFQTVLGPKGNCFAACIASLLEVSTGEVPDLVDGLPEPGEGDDARDWWLALFSRLNDWLRPRGLCYFEVTTQTPIAETYLWRTIAPGMLWIAVGEGLEGSPHAVVMDGYELLHDPHPFGGGLKACFGIGLLVPLDPARRAP
jgi:hypothetical protein